MEFIKSCKLKDFEFTDSARKNVNKLTPKQLEKIDLALSDKYHYNPLHEYEINDMFRLEFPMVCSIGGIAFDTDKNVIVDDVRKWAYDIISKYDASACKKYFDEYFEKSAYNNSITSLVDGVNSSDLISDFADFLYFDRNAQ